MAKINLKKISKEREYLLVADLAHEIWREHYAGIVSADQIEYMLGKFQSPSAIKAAVAAKFGGLEPVSRGYGGALDDTQLGAVKRLFGV